MQAYAHILQAIADGEQIEVLEPYLEGSTLQFLLWVNKTSTEVLQAIVNQKDSSCFRIASNEKTIDVNVPGFPEPERTVLELGTEYYTPNLFAEEMLDYFVWSADDYDKRNLERGIVHLTKAAAILHAKAALSLTDFRYIHNQKKPKLIADNTSKIHENKLKIVFNL